MHIDWAVVVTVATAVLGAAAGAWFTRLAERRPRLVTYYGHSAAFTLDGPAGPTTIHTHEVVIRNDGGKTANNVRVGHNLLPDFQVNPPRQYQVVDLSGGAKEIVIATLVPKEAVTISYLYFPPVTWHRVNTYVKSDEGLAQVQTVLLQRQLPKWLTVLSGLLFVLGAISALYVIVESLRWLFSRI